MLRSYQGPSFSILAATAFTVSTMVIIRNQKYRIHVHEMHWLLRSQNSCYTHYNCIVTALMTNIQQLQASSSTELPNIQNKYQVCKTIISHN